MQNLLHSIRLLSCLMLLNYTSSSQIDVRWNPLPQYPETWDSQWITHPGIDKTAFGLIHFRNRFNLNEVPEKFVVHVSGDNRYRLYVNGAEVAYGPQLGDIRNWRYETLDLAPWLRRGENILAGQVIII